jgi:hypothetical protein
MNVIYFLEPVDVHKQDAELPTISAHSSKTALHVHFRMTPVSELREGVEQGHLLQILHLALRFYRGLVISEQFYGSDDVALCVFDGSDTRGYGYSMALLVPKIYCVFHGAPGNHASLGRTQSAVAQRHPLLIYMIEDIVPASTANHFTARKSGDSFRSFAPVGNSSVSIQQVKALVHIVQNVFVDVFSKFHY